MTSKPPISLKEAVKQFSLLRRSLNADDKRTFVSYVLEDLSCDGEDDYNLFDDESVASNVGSSEKVDEDLLDDPVATLNSIADDIKKKVPINAILSSENITAPSSGQNSDCLPDLTVHVDEFLYNDEDVEELVEDGKLKRNYCKDCGSKNIEPLIFISHSMSREALYYVFNTRLPTLENKIVLDIGSRLGAVLYGAYVFTDAPRIIGVEMNEDLCKLQNEIVQNYKMNDRIEILHKRIEEDEEIVKTADVIIINNAFEFYVSSEKQIEIWQFLRRHIKSKTILVTRPHLETSFKNLQIGIDLKEWVKSYDIEGKDANDYSGEMEESEHCDIAFYEIL